MTPEEFALDGQRATWKIIGIGALIFVGALIVVMVIVISQRESYRDERDTIKATTDKQIHDLTVERDVLLKACQAQAEPR
jgi:hypothetical protein